MAEQRDIQLESLEKAVSETETRLKRAESNVADIERRLKNSEDDFKNQLAERSAQYKKQSGVNLNRVVDGSGRVTYEFTREATNREQRHRRTYNLRRNFTIDREDNTEIQVNSADELHKPRERRRYIAYHLAGYRRIELSTEANPFLRTIGAPIVLPVQAAAVVARAIRNGAEYVADSPVGRGVRDAAAIVTAPVVIPYRAIRDIVEQGGIIHSVVNAGNRVRFEIELPRPVTGVAHAVTNISLAGETLLVESARSTGRFAVEIATDQLYAEVNKAIAENDSTEAAYIIGMRLSEVYRILDRHDRYRRAVRRDRAGGDITDINVSKHLAYQEEQRFQNRQDILSEQKAAAEHSVNEARHEYEAAKQRLDNYRKSHGLPVTKSIVQQSDEPVTLTRTERQIERTKQRLRINSNHRYRTRFRRVVNNNGELSRIPRPVIVREELTGEPPANAVNTLRSLDEWGVNTVLTSMRRKAMRDGGDNSAVEAANSGIIALQQANRFVVATDERIRQFSEHRLENRLHTLENRQNFESKLHERNESLNRRDRRTNQNKRNQKQRQRESMNRRNHRNAISHYREMTRRAVNDRVREVVVASARRTGAIVILLAIIIIIPLTLFMSCGGDTTFSIAKYIAPCEDRDLTAVDLYFTELAKNLIDEHDNIEDYYPDYDEYSCITDIDELYHSAQTLLPYVGAKVAAQLDNIAEATESDFTELAKPYVEEIFNALYEFNADEVHETRKNVWNESDSYDSPYYDVGGSVYTVGERKFYSSDYDSDRYYTHEEKLIYEWDEEETIYDVGKYEDSDGNIVECDGTETKTFTNHHKLYLVYDWFDDISDYKEYWVEEWEYQDWEEYDYYSLEYGIIQKEDYDTLIEKLVSELSTDEGIAGTSESEFYDNFYEYFMGHQTFNYPFNINEIEIVTEYGYGTTIGKDTGMRNYIEIAASDGKEIRSAISGTITALENGNGFALSNKAYGTIYYENCTVPEMETATLNQVISKCTGDVLRITYEDNDGNTQNPIFLFE